MRYKTPAAHGMAVKEAAKKSPLDANRAIAGIGIDDFISFSFDKAEPIKADGEHRSGMKVWFTPSLGGKSLQAASVDLVVDEIDDVAPDMATRCACAAAACSSRVAARNAEPRSPGCAISRPRNPAGDERRSREPKRPQPLGQSL